MKKFDKTPHAAYGAKTRSGTPCQNWGMPNGRCRMHGGKSTGPKTAEGIERIRKANWKHGKRSAHAREEHRKFWNLLRSAKRISKAIEEALENDSVSREDFRVMRKQESDILDELYSMQEKFNYLSFRDRLALAKYLQKQIERIMEFSDRTKELLKMRPIVNTVPENVTY
jgi:hypothetical protein